MKKMILTMALTCLMTKGAEAQIGPYDTYMRMPSADLYDMGMMNAYARVLAEAAARRQEIYDRYSNMAVEAYKNRQWNSVIYYVNMALETKYYSGQLYYIRGYAYEQNGNLRAAKKDYKKGKKYGSIEAARALEALKAKSKRR